MDYFFDQLLLLNFSNFLESQIFSPKETNNIEDNNQKRFKKILADFGLIE